MSHQTKPLATKAATRISSLFLGFALLSMASFSSFAAKTPRMSELLDNNGFQTLLFALQATDLTSVIDNNKVTLFGPTDDVFDATAELLGCASAVDLAEKLLAIDVDGTDALTHVLTYHVYLGKLKDPRSILTAGKLDMANGKSIVAGTGMYGQNVKGDVNAEPSNITTAAFKAKRGSTLYGIDSILLPIDPTGVCAED
ncbi:MAG: fasciclin domain-containing protein [Gammaproteobacteria bacterium]|nr:fasciclin domain-containing protein [Gammaproteobacteria bacterium]